MKVTISCHLVRFQNENVNNTLAGPIMYNTTALRYQRQTSFQLNRRRKLRSRFDHSTNFHRNRFANYVNLQQ